MSAPLPRNVTWDADTHTLTAGASPSGSTATNVLVWVLRGLAVVLATGFFLGSLVLAEDPAWLVLLVPPVAWLATARLRRGTERQDAAWQARLDPIGIRWQDTGQRGGALRWEHVAALRTRSQWAPGNDHRARWLEAVEPDGTSHRLPGVLDDRRWPEILRAARHHGVLPDHVELA